MSVSHQKKSDAQKALWKNPAYREKMMAHHKVKQDKGNCHLFHEKKVDSKGELESLERRDSKKNHGF